MSSIRLLAALLLASACWAQSSFNSDAADGYQWGTSGTWSNARDNASGSSDTFAQCRIGAVWESPNFQIERCILVFDTSAIDPGDTITAVNLDVRLDFFDLDDDDADAFIAVVDVDPSTCNSLVTGDYTTYTTTELHAVGARLDMTGKSAGNRYDWDLNSTGFAEINKTGYTCLGLREGHDLLDSPISTSGDNWNNFYISAEEDTPSTFGADLTVTHAAAGGVLRREVIAGMTIQQARARRAQ